MVRQFIYPDHRLKYIGTTAYRALADARDILSIPGIPDSVTFWHGPADRLYTCNLNNNVYEIAARVPQTADTAPVSWGQDASVEEFSWRYKVATHSIRHTFLLTTWIGLLPYAAKRP